MTTDSDEWHVTTDHSRIVDWAEERDLTPVRADDEIDLVSEPGPGEARRVPWDEFFERFEAEGVALRFRADAETDERSGYELVERESGGDPEPATTTEGESSRDSEGLLDDEFADSRKTGDELASEGDEGEPETERMALSDTGDAEPVVEDEIEGDAAGEREDDEAVDEETAMSESARGAERPTLVLDEIYEDPGFGESVDDEYVVLRNTGDQPVDLSGWVLENGAGKSFGFPDDYTLDSGERVTVHSSHGADEEHDLYWGAKEAVWDDEGGTVVVRTPGGEQVVREPFKG